MTASALSSAPAGSQRYRSPCSHPYCAHRCARLPTATPAHRGSLSTSYQSPFLPRTSGNSAVLHTRPDLDDRDMAPESGEVQRRITVAQRDGIHQRPAAHEHAARVGVAAKGGAVQRALAVVGARIHVRLHGRVYVHMGLTCSGECVRVSRYVPEISRYLAV